MRKEESLKPLIFGKQREEVDHADDNSISFCFINHHLAVNYLPQKYLEEKVSHAYLLTLNTLKVFPK